MLYATVGCCWMLLVPLLEVVGCCSASWMLLDVVMDVVVVPLLGVVGCCWVLLGIVGCCSATAGCCWML